MLSRERYPRLSPARCLIFALWIPCLLMLNCQSFWSLTGYRGALTEWCELSARCETNGSAQTCEQQIGQLLSEGRPGDTFVSEDARWNAWLHHFSDKACLSNCQHAQRCLDFEPICRMDFCDTREDCCGFSTARTDCDTRKSPGTCCRVRGRPCGPDAGCCPNAGPCESGFCGGVACLEIGQDCAQDFQCCTKVCKNNRCAEDVCSLNGFGCAGDSDCCSKYCDPTLLKCSAGACVQETAPCIIDAMGGDNCCDGLACYEEGGKQGICSRLDCNSIGVECAGDASCCSQKCDQTFRKCTECKADTEACQTAGECCSGACVNNQCGACVQENMPCGSGGECCSGKCENGQCAPLCSAGCAHDECTAGSALSPQCSACDNGACNSIDSSCISAVCQFDPYCCCTQWDSLCVSELKAQCDPAVVCEP